MAEIATLGRPYAEAAFRLARERGALPAWASLLERLAGLAEDTRIGALLNDPNVALEELKALFCAGAGPAAPAETANFVALLADNRRLACLPEIVRQFEAMKQDAEGIRQAVVYSAFPLDDRQRRELAERLETRFGRLLITVAVDPQLIGGVKVVVGDQVLDTSVSGKLAAMRVALTS